MLSFTPAERLTDREGRPYFLWDCDLTLIQFQTALRDADPGVPAFGQKGSTLHVQETIRALAGRGARVELFACRLDGGPPGDRGSRTSSRR